MNKKCARLSQIRVKIAATQQKPDAFQGKTSIDTHFYFDN
jgi:hypothetical protein